MRTILDNLSLDTVLKRTSAADGLAATLENSGDITLNIPVSDNATHRWRFAIDEFAILQITAFVLAGVPYRYAVIRDNLQITQSSNSTNIGGILSVSAGSFSAWDPINTIDVYFNLQATKTFANTVGDKSEISQIKVLAGTYASSHAMTISNLATLTINGSPSVSGGVVATNRMALWVQSGNSRFEEGVFANLITAGSGFNTVGNAFYVDETGYMGIQYLEAANGISCQGNITIGGASSNADKALVLGNNATPPSVSTDAATLFGKDVSAGNATLAIATERTVAIDAAIATHTLRIFINDQLFDLLLKAVP